MKEQSKFTLQEFLDILGIQHEDFLNMLIGHGCVFACTIDNCKECWENS